MKVKLRHVAHARAGDKGNTSNIGVFAYDAELYALLKAQLTADAFKAFYGSLVKGPVERYEVDGVWGLNFVAREALGGGVSRSIRFDPYGKSLSSAIMGFEIEVPERLHNHLRGWPPRQSS
jgi:hypothetical protein